MSDRSHRFVEHFAAVNVRWLISIVLGVATLTGVVIQSMASVPVLLDVEDSANEIALSTDYETDPQASGTGQIYGYGSASSVAQGESIDFHVATNVATYDIQIFREGASGREWMRTVLDVPGSGSSPSKCDDDDVGTLVDDSPENPPGCGWSIAYTLNVPANWPSGIYVADLLDENDEVGGYGSYIIFIVTEDEPGSTADILFQSSTNTWQAYNNYGGLGLYTDPRAIRVTFDRPFPRCTGCKFGWEIPLARWLESEGYAVEYVANEDVHNDPTLLYNYKLFLSVGHDEYWTKEARDNIDAFIDAGGNVAIFSGNTAYRQVRYEDEMRTLVSYKSDYKKDPLYGVDNIRVTASFSNKTAPNWPQNSTIGLGWTGWVNQTPGNSRAGRYTVYRSGHWVYEGTGLQDEDEFWYEPLQKVEVDGAAFTWVNGVPVVTGEEGTPLDFTILGLQQATKGYATMGLYTREEGGTVFNAATYGWGNGLWPEYNPEDYELVRQITRNVVDTLSSGDPVPAPVYAVQEVSYTYQPVTPLEGEALTFTTVITPWYATAPVSYVWQFGDGTSDVTTSSEVVSHTFSAGGVYSVSVTAANSSGQSVYEQSVEVLPINLIEDASFTYQPFEPRQFDQLTFTANIAPSYATLPISYTWLFGDGTPAVVTDAKVVSHAYNTAGTYTASLTAASPYGQTAYNETIEILPVYAVTETSFTHQPLLPMQFEVVTFTVDITPSNATLPISYTWQFDDGSPTIVTSSEVLSHAFGTGGTHTISVTAANAYGQGAYEQSVEVTPVYALTETSVTHQPLLPVQFDMVTFTADVTPSFATPPITYTWQLDDGSPTIVTDSDVISHTFDTGGTHTISVTAVNAYGQGAYELSIDVTPVYTLTETSFTYQPLQLAKNAPVTFTASIIPSYATAPVAYAWHFGDSMPTITTTSSIVQHTYDAPGNYTVVLTATNAYGQNSYNSQISVAVSVRVYLPTIIKGP